MSKDERDLVIKDVIELFDFGELARDSVKIGYGKEAMEDHFILRFPSPEHAQAFLRTNRPKKLKFNEQEVYLNLNKFGRERILEMLSKRAQKLIVQKSSEFGLANEGVVAKASFITGGLCVNRHLIGHIDVGKNRDESGHFPVSFRPCLREAQKINFDTEKFAKTWKADCRI